MYASCLFHESILVVSYNNRMKCTHNLYFAYGRFSSVCIFLFPAPSHMYSHCHTSLCITLHTGRLSSFCPFLSSLHFAEIVF